MRVQHYIQLFCVLLTSMLAFSSVALAEDPYTIDNIAVTAKGNNATEASLAATSSAEKQAFSILLERLGVTNAPPLTPEDISSLVSGMEVHNEKVTPSYYSATVSISFSPFLVKDRLRNAGIQKANDLDAATTPTSKPTVLVLPFLVNDQDAALIIENEAWYQSWRNLLPNISSANIQLASSAHQLPLLTSYLKTPNATLGNPEIEALKEEIIAIKKRYNASFVFAATAYTAHTLGSTETAGYLVEISDGTPSSSLLFPSDNDVATGIEHDYHSMAAQMSDYFIKDIGKRTTAVMAEIVVTIPITSLSSWIDIQKQLRAIDGIDHLTIEKMTHEKALVHLHFSTDYSTLKERLSRASFTLNTSDNGLIINKTSISSSPNQPQQ